MVVTVIQTHAVAPHENIFDILTTYLPEIHEGDVIAVTSKLVSVCEGALVPGDQNIKEQLIAQESEYYLPRTLKRFGVQLTINYSTLIANAGIDESNGNGTYILWPRQPFRSAEALWNHIRNTYRITQCGIIITDSVVVPLRWGTRGIGIAWCGFLPLRNYIGQPDIYGKELKVTKLSLLDSYAAAAVSVMGEGNERTPIAVIHEPENVQYTTQPPTEEEIAALHIELQDDLFSPLLTSVPWQTKHGKNERI